MPLAHAGSVVDGHSTHGADSQRALNTDSSAALRRRYGHPVVSVPDSLSRSNATKWAGHSPAARAAPLKPVLQLLEGEPSRGVPYDQIAVQRGRVRQLRGPRKRRKHVGAAPGAQHHPARSTESRLGIVFGALSLGLGAAFGRRTVVLAGTAAIGVLAYSAHTFAAQIGADRLAYLSPFHHYIGGQPLRNGFQWADIGILAATASALVALGTWRFARRDINT
ncbi:ABC-2 transporter permease [Streptomyces europaeiscabiei]|uniref:hypothetical protein n=1 Tax=Streptomyces europaeiscabiei TaxID=146819 RepID=UPI000A5B6068|nr:hypothetical protein [Streptomyces europaeiscabiei]MDX2761008.1 hypothetical protein [Streptomyces europaeiscabiei]MDX3867583.1 hypothetical protein [Streptomyces europaeiscabiei]